MDGAGAPGDKKALAAYDDEGSAARLNSHCGAAASHKLGCGSGCRRAGRLQLGFEIVKSFFDLADQEQRGRIGIVAGFVAPGDRDEPQGVQQGLGSITAGGDFVGG
jgi:hypothetical protein